MSEVKKIATRASYGNALVELGKKHDDLVVLDADLAAATQTGIFKKAFPERHIDCGIAECNMMGIAAGIATTGKVPFASTFAMFAAGRAFEQVRNSVGYPKLNVKIACSHGGVTPANDGASHQCIEDMGVLRTLPNMTVIMPADYWSARRLVEAAAEFDGPVYLRFTRDAIPVIYDENATFEIGRVLDMHTIKPLDVDAVQACINDIGKIISVEDHNIINGLGGAVCEVVAEAGKGKVKRVGIQDQFGQSAPYERLLAINGITVENIVELAKGEW